MMIDSVKQYVKCQRLAFLPEEKLEDYDREQVINAIKKLNSVFFLNILIAMRVARRLVFDLIL
jgi:hypothetical protein